MIEAKVVADSVNPQGDSSPNKKLSEEIVFNIRQELREGKKGKVLSKKYSISEGMISLIKHNKNWV